MSSMLGVRQAKTRRGKRALEKKEPQVVENVKSCMFVRGSKVSEVVLEAVDALILLKKPNAVKLSRKNEYHPFDDIAPFEFLSNRNESSLFVFGSHSKKRPHNLTFGRMFNYQLLDMYELGITSYKKACEKPHKEIGGIKVKAHAVGSKPCMMFQGDGFENNAGLKSFKSLLVDMFRGEVVDSINLAGLDHVLVATALNDSTIALRHYAIVYLKSGTKVPFVQLEDIGPSLNLELRRFKLPDAALMKQALKKPREINPKNKKNIDQTLTGETLARVHLGKQDLAEMSLARMKGLNKKRRVSHKEHEEAQDEDGEEGGNQEGMLQSMDDL